MKQGSSVALVSILFLVILTSVSLAWLNVSYQSPASGSSQKIPLYNTFNVTVNVTCIGGDCGNVTGTLRYNSSAGLNPNVAVSNTTIATPFYVTDNSLRAWWKLDEGSGQYVNDSSFYGLNGTLGGSSGVDTSDPVWTNGKSGGALLFDGKDDFVNLTVVNYSFGSTKVSVELWVMVNTTSNSPCLLQYHDGNGNTGWRICVNASGNPYFDWTSMSGTPYSRTIANNTMSSGAWHHIVVTDTGTFARFYLDGNLSGTNNTSSKAFFPPLYIFMGT